MSMTGLLSAEALAPALNRAAEIRSQVEAIDDQINQEAAGPRRVRNQAADAVAGSQAENLKQVKAMIDELFGADRVGLVVLLSRTLAEYKEEVDNFVKENVVENDVELSVEEQTRLRTERKNLVDAYKALRTSLEVMAPSLLSEVPEIKNLRGAIGGSGSRGPRLKGSWKFVIDGVEIAGTTLTDVKNAVGVESVADVRAAIGSDFDWDTRSNFSFTVNGKNVEAKTTESDPEDVADVDENDEVNDDIFGDEAS